MKNGTLVLALVSLVMLGFAAGYGTHLLLTKKHIEQVARLATGGGFTARMIHLLEPTDAQEQKILPILAQHEKMVDSLSTSYHEVRRSAIDELRNDLELILTTEQKERLANHFKRVKKRFREHPVHRKKRMEKRRQKSESRK
ncbi:MAG: hypothetical protein AAGH79_10575 [Bacteroidota bacterium]